MESSFSTRTMGETVEAMIHEEVGVRGVVACFYIKEEQSVFLYTI